MDQSLQRDFGRLEAKVEIITEDTKAIKSDLAEIKQSLAARNAVRSSDLKRLGLVGILASIATHFIAWAKPFFT